MDLSCSFFGKPFGWAMFAGSVVGFFFRLAALENANGNFICTKCFGKRKNPGLTDPILAAPPVTLAAGERRHKLMLASRQLSVLWRVKVGRYT